MSGQQNGANSRTLLLEARELAVLLAGCGIGELYLPGSVSLAVTSENDVTESMMALVRDGLMTQAPDGVLDYAEDLRDTLRVLRDCSMSVLLWTGGSLTGHFQLGCLGTMGAFAFFFSAKVLL